MRRLNDVFNYFFPLRAIALITSQKPVSNNVDVEWIGSMKWEICFANIGIWHKTVFVFCDLNSIFNIGLIVFKRNSQIEFAHSILNLVCVVCYLYLKGKWMAMRKSRRACARRSMWFWKYVIFLRTDFPLQGLSKHEFHQPRSEMNVNDCLSQTQMFRSNYRNWKQPHKSRSEFYDIFSNSKTIFSLRLLLL